MHPLLERPAEQQQNHAEPDRPFGNEREHAEISVEADLEVGHLPTDRVDAGELRDNSGEILRDRNRQEPHTHHHPDDARDRQLGDHREPDRRNAQLGEAVDEVEAGQPPHRYLEGRIGPGRTPHQEQEAGADAHQGDPELDRDGRLQPAPGKAGPQHRHQRRQKDDEQRVERLRLAGADAPAEDRQVGVAVGEQGQRGAGLFEQGPEDDVEHDQDHRRDHHLEFAAVAVEPGPGEDSRDPDRKVPNSNLPISDSARK